jgi:leucyl-tRNA synthetase
MKLLNILEKTTAMAGTPGSHKLLIEGMSILLRLLSPITPHIAHVLWQELGFEGVIIDAPWPEKDEKALVQAEVELVLQVNGKLRGNIRVDRQADRRAIEHAALANPNAQKFIEGRPIKKVVVVPGRLVNIVV